MSPQSVGGAGMIRQTDCGVDGATEFSVGRTSGVLGVAGLVQLADLVRIA